MSGNLPPGQAAPYAAHPAQGYRAMEPGEGPIADQLQRLGFNSQLPHNGYASGANGQSHNSSRPKGSSNKSSGSDPSRQPTLEHWTITRYASPQVTNPAWRVSQRHRDHLSESQIKAKIERQRTLFKKPLRVTSSDISPNQKRQIEDLVRHRNHADLNPWSEWVLKALDQDKDKGKVQAVKVIIGSRKPKNARQITPYRWQEVHEVDDPNYRERQQHANYPQAAQAWPQNQYRAETGFSTMQNFNGQNPTQNIQQQGRGPPQMDQMFGQVREMVNSGSAQQHAPRQNGMANNLGGPNHQHPMARAPQQYSQSKGPQAQNPRNQGGSKPRPKPQIHQLSDSEGSSRSSMSDSDDASESGRETAPSEYSQQTRYSHSSHKARRHSPIGSRHKTSSHSGKGSKTKLSSRSSTSSKHHSRRAERGSSSFDEDSSAGDSFVEHGKTSRKAKGHRNPSVEPKIRQHHRPMTRDVSPRSLPRRYSHASAVIQPARSSRSRTTPSHSRGYSIDSLGSSPQETGYYPSSRHSMYGPHIQRAWELEQKESQLGMENEMLRRRKQQLDEKELALLRQQMHPRERIMDKYGLDMAY